MFMMNMFLTVTFVSAWAGPTGTAPANNAAAPLNVSSTGQVKNGDLGLNNLLVSGNLQLAGANGAGNAYLAFGTATGSAAYGIRDNNGQIEVKNAGSIWQTISALAASSTVSGSPAR